MLSLKRLLINEAFQCLNKDAKKEGLKMTVGESIKYHRTQLGLTQKDLSEKLNVSFQTVSKWENNTNEPDLTTLKAMCDIFGCTVDDLISYKGTVETEAVEEPEVIPAEPQIAKIQIGTCRDCGKALYSGDNIHHMNRRSTSGIQETVDVCDDCFKRHEELNRKKEELEKPSVSKKPAKTGAFSRITERADSKVVIWSIVVGIVALITTLIICICNYNSVGIGWTIGLPLIVGYVLLADIYCIFSASWVSDVFMNVASWSIRFPGIIFSFDLNGLKFLIAMKLLFFILGILISIGAFLLAVVFSSICSIFTFPFLVVYNKNHY